ncbi:MAG: hypothetical protein E7461_02000 [Ruminococcaceae bacterium]|nr:hypothetical protein [Oscillospiraceae bacterium]
MLESRKIVIRETLYILVGVLVLTAVMFCVYALLGLFDLSVLLGGIVGIVLACGNFFFMAVTASMAADKAEEQDVAGGTQIVRLSYPLRLLVLAGLLLVCGLSGFFDPIALVLPLAFVRPVLMLSAFFRKGDGK